MSPRPVGAPAAAERDALAALDAGDLRTALDVLMQAYGTTIYRFCRQMTADAALADDVHQMTFVQAYEGLERFSRRSTLSTWLFSIARHRCLDALKVSRRRRARFEAMDELPEVPVAESGGEHRLQQGARAQALHECLQQLRDDIRTAILLRFQEELSYVEMSRACGDRPATLQARVVRALPALRRCLERRGATP
jgi:RNA polymerase sigma-70 factor, ECF subfamily